MKKVTLGIMTVSLALMAGCSKGSFAPVDTSKQIIKVNSGVITENMYNKSFQQAINSSPLAGKGLDAADSKNQFLSLIFKNRVVNELIIKELIYQEAQKRKIEVSNKEIDKTIEEIADKLGGKAKLESTMTLNNVKMEDLKNNIKLDILTKKLVENVAGEIKPAEKELKAFYDKNKESKFSNPDLVRASHILISTPDMTNKTEVKTAQAKAEKILAEVKAHPEKFSEIAQKNSDDPGSAEKGGDLSFFKKGDMVPEFSKVAFSLKPGTVSEIVKTQYGFHIIKVTDRKKAGVVPFVEVKAEIGKYIADTHKIKVMQKMLEASRNTAKIVYLDPQYDPKKISDDIQTMAKQNKIGKQGMPIPVKTGK
jgi:parvulin-like peptidyl-prolyl isomerase